MQQQVENARIAITSSDEHILTSSSCRRLSIIAIARCARPVRSLRYLGRSSAPKVASLITTSCAVHLTVPASRLARILAN